MFTECYSVWNIESCKVIYYRNFVYNNCFFKLLFKTFYYFLLYIRLLSLVITWLYDNVCSSIIILFLLLKYGIVSRLADECIWAKSRWLDLNHFCRFLILINIHSLGPSYFVNIMWWYLLTCFYMKLNEEDIDNLFYSVFSFKWQICAFLILFCGVKSFSWFSLVSLNFNFRFFCAGVCWSRCFLLFCWVIEWI